MRLPVCALASLLATLAAVAAEPERYTCVRASVPVTIDGRLEDPAWQAASWTKDFVDIEGDARPRPRFRTRAKMLWDDQYFYVAAEMEEPHVWGTLTDHDAVIFRDNDFEIFLNPTGDALNYFEFEINALNTGWDLFLPKAYNKGGKADNSWEIPGLRTAVNVQGTLNDSRDEDRGWSVEVAIPWSAFAARAAVARPTVGAVWRVNFSRVEWRVDVVNGRYQKVAGLKEDNWVWSPQGAINMHVPEKWGFVEFAGAASQPPGMKVDRNIAYARADGKDLLLDLYRPEKQEGPLPVVVWIYGGAFRMGSKDDGQTAGATWLTNHGYAVVAFNYRLSQVAKFPAQIQDCKSAIRWVRANAAAYGLNPDRIAVWGASAGGHLSAMLGASGGVAELEGNSGNAKESSRVQAVVDFFGPTDFLQMDAKALPGGMKHDPADSPESQLVGGPIQENKDKVARANPITYVTKDAPPFLILHGEQDPLVPVNQSELLFEALKKAGVNVTFHKIAGAGHGGRQFSTPAVRAMVLAFLDQHLKTAAK